MSPTATETATRRFLDAAAALLQAATDQARQEDPQAFDSLAALLKAGGLVELRSTFAPATGLAWMAVEVVAPSGERHTLAAAELHRLPVQ